MLFSLSNHLPEFGRTADHRKEHAIQIEIVEASTYRNAVEGESNNGHGQIQRAANHVIFPNVWLGRVANNLRAATPRPEVTTIKSEGI